MRTFRHHGERSSVRWKLQSVLLMKFLCHPALPVPSCIPYTILDCIPDCTVCIILHSLCHPAFCTIPSPCTILHSLLVRVTSSVNRYTKITTQNKLITDRWTLPLAQWSTTAQQCTYNIHMSSRQIWPMEYKRPREIKRIMGKLHLCLPSSLPPCKRRLW